MKKLLLMLFFLNSLIYWTYASPPTKAYTFSSGDTISSSEVNADFDNLYNYLTSGVDTFKDATIVNDDVSTAANIQSDKLNLTSIAQDIALTGTLSISTSLTCTTTTSIGWSVVGSTNQNCNTTCTKGCIFGQDQTTGYIKNCDDASSDLCLCGGAN